MAWVENHTTLRSHKKLKMLCDELEINRREAAGMLGFLWAWAILNREDGDMEGIFEQDIASACDWPGDPIKLKKALYKTGFIDKDTNFLHEWLDYAGKFLTGKYASRNRDRLVEIWKKHGKVYGEADLNKNHAKQHAKQQTQQHAEHQGEVGPNSMQTSTKPNLTKPNQTKDKEKTVFSKDQEEKVKNLLLFRLKIPEDSEAFRENFKEICEMAATKKDPYAWATDHINREIEAIENKKRFDGLVEDIVNKPKFFNEIDRLTIEDILTKDFGLQKDTKDFAIKMGALWENCKNYPEPFKAAIKILESEAEARGIRLNS